MHAVFWWKSRRKKWATLSSTEWPTHGAGWPEDGTFNPNVISQVKDCVCRTGPQGLPDQVPYITVWEDLVRNLPVWVKPFLSPTPSAEGKSQPKPPPPPPTTPLIPLPSPACCPPRAC